MEYKIHKVVADEKLADIAEKYNVSIDEIKKENPKVRFFKSFFGVEYVGHLQNLKIPITKPIEIEKSENEKILDSLNFEKVTRYRCTQNNVTKALDSVTFSSEIKTQYLLSVAKNESKYFHVQLEDYIFQITPKDLDVTFQLVKPIEFLKNNVKFSQNNQAEFTKIINLNQIKQKWINFRNNVLPEIKFFKRLKQQSEKASTDFIKTSNLELTNELKFKEILGKNLFYHILLKANSGDDLEDYSFSQFSQIFPNQEITVRVSKTKVSENENTKVFRLVGELDREKLSEEKLLKQYNEIYKPLLKFAFTEFDYVYRITYTLDAETGLLIDSKASINEKIKNNFESITQFEIKQVEL